MEEAKPKLPYFHRELSKEELALLGDQAPKPINTAAQNNSFSGPPTSGSAWNAAGSWEEKDTSKQCKELFESLLDGEWGLDAIGVNVLSCQSLEGDASLVHSKGKARYLYSYEVKLKSEITVEDKVYEFTLLVHDLTNDQDLEDYDLEVAWTSKSPPGPLLAKAKKQLLSKDTKQALRKKVEEFEAGFRAHCS